MRKLMVFLLTAVICLSCVTIQADAVSTDESTQSAAVLNMMGAIEGDGSGSLGLSGTLTRAEFCKIAVVVMGLSKNVKQYAGYTIFPDVPSSNWAAGYVNLAVRSAGVMSGYPNGKFGPNDTITYGQVITVLMRMLGYTSTDVGNKWPDNYLEKADEIGLTSGVSLSADSGITKGDVAVLFVNLLNTEINNSSKKYMETISGATVIGDVFLVSANAETDSGAKGAVKIAGTKNAAYLPAGSVPESLVGAFGSLVLNSAGKAFAFVPTNSGKTVISTVQSATASYIRCADGTKISMTASPAFYANGESSSYADAWISISGGMLVSAYYTDGGTVENVLVTSGASSDGNVTVVTSDSYAVPESTAVYINGNPAAASDIVKYDVISYDDAYGVCSVSRRAVTGRYDSAYPNGENAETITVLGREFTVLDSAVDALAGFTVGSSVTLLLTTDDAVAGVVPSWAVSRTNYGVVKSLTSSSATVELTCGVIASGEVSNVSGDIGVGSLVTVGAYEKATLSLSPVYATTSGYLNLSDGTLGGVTLSKAVTVYECVGTSGVTKISLTDIPGTTVDSSKVKFAAFDSSGKVNLLLLNDVTGDRYTYGVIKNGIKTETVSIFTVTNATTTLTNGDGSLIVIGSTSLNDGTYCGVASSVSGTLAGYATLTAVPGVSRSGFKEGTDGTLYVSTSGGLIPVSDSVQAYIAATDAWTTLAHARSYSDNLTVYYDRTPSAGGSVRVIVAN